jgi:hypothetical protein
LRDTEAAFSSFPFSVFGGGGFLRGPVVVLSSFSGDIPSTKIASGSNFWRFACGEPTFSSLASLLDGDLRIELFLEIGFPAKTASPSPSVAEKES